MILLRILEHDLHRSRQGDAIPLWLEVPARAEFLPALVSSSRGKFLTSRKLVDSGDGKGSIRVGVFRWDSDRLDDLIGDMCSAALGLSKTEGWGNVFSGNGAVRRAFDYVSKSSGVGGQPHACLIPEAWDAAQVRRAFGVKNLDEHLRKYRRYCRLVPCRVSSPVFLSRPDFVGMYTQFLGGSSGIVLHNVRLGMGFCP